MKLFTMITMIQIICVIYIIFFSEIIRTDDYNIKLLDGKQADDFYILKDSDFASVSCKSQNGNVLVNLFN